MVTITESNYHSFESHHDLVQQYVATYLLMKGITDDWAYQFQTDGDFAYYYKNAEQNKVFIPGLKKLSSFLERDAYEMNDFSNELFELQIDRFLKGYFRIFIYKEIEFLHDDIELDYKKTYIGSTRICYNQKGLIFIKVTLPKFFGNKELYYSMYRENILHNLHLFDAQSYTFFYDENDGPVENKLTSNIKRITRQEYLIRSEEQEFVYTGNTCFFTFD